MSPESISRSNCYTGRISKYEFVGKYTQQTHLGNHHIEEMQLLENAVSLERNPRYMVQLAVRYSTCAVNTFYKYKDTNGYLFNSELDKSITIMEEKALELCKEALELAPGDEVVNRRCGFALMKASYKVAKKNKHLIKKALEKSLEISPLNSMTLHCLGKYYIKLERNNEKALECFENASKEDSNFNAQCDLIKLKFKINGVDGYDPSEDLDNMLEKQSRLDVYYKLIVLSYIVSYLLLLKGDLNKALEYFEQLIDEVGEESILKEHQPIFAVSYEMIDLYKIIANEIMMADQSKEFIRDKQEVVSKIKSKVPEYFSEPVEKNLREQTLSRLVHIQKYDPRQNPNRWNHGKVGWQNESSSSNRSSSTRNYGNQRTTNSSTSSNWRSRNSSELGKSNENWRSKK